jgi:purine-binding chemotaxis protein CheW
MMDKTTDNSMIKASAEQQETRAVRIMFVGSQCIGLFADEIESIAEWRQPTPLPDAPPSVLGVVCIRGRMLTVLGANALLGETAAPQHSKVVALRGDEQIGLAVDRTGDLVEISPDDLKPASEKDSLVLGVIAKSEQSISVLDPKQLFATAMRGRERRRRGF